MVSSILLIYSHGIDDTFVSEFFLCRMFSLGRGTLVLLTLLIFVQQEHRDTICHCVNVPGPGNGADVVTSF